MLLYEIRLYFIILIQGRIDMAKDNEQPNQDKPATKEKRQRTTFNTSMYEKLAAKLGQKAMTKEELAGELEIDNPKSLTDSVFLAAVKITGDSKFLKNLVEKKTGKPRKNPQYVKNRGLQITPWHFNGKDIPDKQRYRVEFNSKTKAITLHPTDDEFIIDDNK
jgi:hypothetical protein